MAAKICNVCNVRRVYTGSKGTETAPHGTDLCNYCYEEGGYENQHSDHNHDGILKNGPQNEHDKDELDFMQGCWICHPELNLAQQKPQAKAAPKAKKVQGFRRTQLNHKEMCTHAQTPKARRTCKEAFWAGVAILAKEQGLTEDQSWEEAIKHLTANAKLQETEMVPTSPAVANLLGWNVVPRGPKGGVINQLKKGPAVSPSKATKTSTKKAANKFLTQAEGKKLYGK